MQSKEKLKPDIFFKANQLAVSNAEFEMIQEFTKFVRERERGTFTADINTQGKRRFVLINKTDKVKIELTESEYK